MIRTLRSGFRRVLTLFVLLAVLAACLAPAILAQGADRMRVAPGPVAVRENPSVGSPKVMSLKAGQRVRVDYEADGWVAVFPPEQKNRAESSALGYVRLGDLRLAGPLDLRRDGAAPEKDKGEAKAAAPAEKEKEKDKRKADKPKTAAEKKREAKEAKAALEKARKDAKALKTAPKGALTRDELLATPQQKATVRTSSVVVEKAVDKAPEAAPKAADSKLADAKPVDAKSTEAAAKLADQKAAEAKSPEPAPRSAPKPAPPKPAPPKEEDFGVIRVPDRPLAVRAARNKDSEFKKLLQPGQRVRTDMQADGFYAVFAPEERVRDIKRAWGYGRDKYLLTEKEFAARGAAYPPTTAPAAPAAAPVGVPADKPAQPAAAPSATAAQAPQPEIKPETRPEAKAPAPEPRKFTPPRAEPAPAVEPAPKPASQAFPEHKPAQPAQPVQMVAAPGNGAPASAGEEVVGYALMERREDPLRPLAPVLVRVRLDTASAPAQETLRRVVREIWKAERRKADEVVMEVYLTGMDSASLAYAVARFGPDGRIRELHWRDSLVPKKR